MPVFTIPIVIFCVFQTIASSFTDCWFDSLDNPIVFKKVNIVQRTNYIINPEIQYAKKVKNKRKKSYDKTIKYCVL
jgi:hypothetical protein